MLFFKLLQQLLVPAALRFLVGLQVLKSLAQSGQLFVVRSRRIGEPLLIGGQCLAICFHGLPIGCQRPAGRIEFVLSGFASSLIRGELLSTARGVNVAPSRDLRLPGGMLTLERLASFLQLGGTSSQFGPSLLETGAFGGQLVVRRLQALSLTSLLGFPSKSSLVELFGFRGQFLLCHFQFASSGGQHFGSLTRMQQVLALSPFGNLAALRSLQPLEPADRFGFPGKLSVFE